MSPDNYGARHIPEDDLVLFALQLLPEERMRQVMSHLQTCDECRTEIAKFQGDLATYSMTAEPQPPPFTARERFTRQIAREPHVEEIRPVETRAAESRAPESRSPEKLSLSQDPNLSLMGEPTRNDESRFSVEPSRTDHTIRMDEPNLSGNSRRTGESNRAGESKRTEHLNLMGDSTLNAMRDSTRDSMRDSSRDSKPSHTAEPAHGSHPDRELEHAPDEPVFTARNSRTLRTEDHREHDEDLVEERRRPGRAAWVLVWTGWAVAAGCSFVAGLQLHQRQQMQSTLASQQATLQTMRQQAAHAQDAQLALSTLTAANAMQVTLHSAPTLKTAIGKPVAGAKAEPAATAPEALAAYLADKGALVFVATHMQPAPAGKTYELWLLPANGQSPIPAGTFKPDVQGSASVVMPHLPAGVQAKGFGVTIENDGGSQTPTLPIVMS